MLSVDECDVDRRDGEWKIGPEGCSVFEGEGAGGQMEGKVRQVVWVQIMKDFGTSLSLCLSK